MSRLTAATFVDKQTTGSPFGSRRGGNETHTGVTSGNCQRPVISAKVGYCTSHWLQKCGQFIYPQNTPDKACSLGVTGFLTICYELALGPVYLTEKAAKLLNNRRRHKSFNGNMLRSQVTVRREEVERSERGQFTLN